MGFLAPALPVISAIGTIFSLGKDLFSLFGGGGRRQQYYQYPQQVLPYPGQQPSKAPETTQLTGAQKIARSTDQSEEGQSPIAPPKAEPPRTNGSLLVP